LAARGVLLAHRPLLDRLQLIADFCGQSPIHSSSDGSQGTTNPALVITTGFMRTHISIKSNNAAAATSGILNGKTTSRPDPGFLSVETANQLAHLACRHALHPHRRGSDPLRARAVANAVASGMASAPPSAARRAIGSFVSSLICSEKTRRMKQIGFVKSGKGAAQGRHFPCRIFRRLSETQLSAVAPHQNNGAAAS
jgi:hypothetical protein